MWTHKSLYLVHIIICSFQITRCYQDETFQAREDVQRACGIDGVCYCDRFGSFYRVLCNDRNLSSVPEDIPIETTYLKLGRNKLSSLPSDVFQDLPSLGYLYLQNNKLSVLPNNVFRNLTNLSHLLLMANKLTSLPSDIFEDLKSLIFLNIRSNKLSTLPANIFENQRSLETLDIGNNDFSALSHQLFRNITSLDSIYLDNCRLSTLPKDVFEGLRSLTTIDLSSTGLATLPDTVFEDLTALETLFMDKNELSDLPSYLWKHMQSLKTLFLNANKLSRLSSNEFEGLISLTTLNLDHNEISFLQNETFRNMLSLKELYISSNRIRFLPFESFRGLTELDFLDLSNNSLSHIPSGLFNQTCCSHMTKLFLQSNNLTTLQREIFVGLDRLEYLCLYNNRIYAFEETTFPLMALRYLYLFQNNLTNITGNPFNGNYLEQVHVYNNEISNIDARSLEDIPQDTTVYISCNVLNTLPRNSNHRQLKCVSPASVPSIAVPDSVITGVNKTGFNCSKTYYSASCTPCPVGTYGDEINGGCLPCPIGGFYQDEIAQTDVPPDSIWGIPCKVCNAGTYVKGGHGSAPKDCEVCPEGTNQTLTAGFRACYCKEGYARTDRYGPCDLCLQSGLNCSQDFQSLRPGYIRNWSFPGANVGRYKDFVANIKLVVDDQSLPAMYTGEIPRTLKCPRKETCRNDIDNIAGNCANGYTGWLCTSCQPGYYSVLSSCVKCPNLAILLVESGVFFIICALSCLFLFCKGKQNAEVEYQRTVLDVGIARVKILLGFYQVIGEICTSLHDISWTGSLVIVGRFISAFEINILRLFVRPRCFDMKLDLNPKLQFTIGAISPLVIVVIPVLFYQTKKLYIRLRFSTIERLSFQSHFQNLQNSLFSCVLVLWFIIYPPVCSIIFSLYPLSCKTFSLDKNKMHNVTRLRSDYDVDCTGLRMYHIFAYILTITYVIAFPVVLLYLLYKKRAINHIKGSALDYVSSDTTSTLKNRSSECRQPLTWLNFLSENYKTTFWFWEIVELARKVTQTLLITLYGWESRLTIVLTTCISVLFLLLHAWYRPMKSSYEQGLQMFSLSVVFINVIVAANDFSEIQEDSISVILALLNIVVMAIIVGELLLAIALQLQHLQIVNTIGSFLRKCRQRLKQVKGID